MAAGGAPARTLRRGPAPIASFDHDGSDDVRPSSPETKRAPRLPEIREDPASGASLAPPEPRARSHSSPGVGGGGGGGEGAGAGAPRIDISRASSSSHHDSRDSSPELALFAGEDARHRLDAAFREDGALELRSSTEELAFLEGAPGGPAPPPAPRRHSRKDSQGSEAALLAVSGRTSRLSSVGSQCSALSAFSRTSRVSRLSVASGASRSPSPHRMLLETSFCGPKPIETDPEICAAAVEERLLEMAKLSASSPGEAVGAGGAVDARDRREVRTEATVERAARPPPPSPAPRPGPEPPPEPVIAVPIVPDDEKLQKESQNRAKVEERRARPRVRREPSEPEVYKSGNRTKDIIRIKLKPDDEYEEEKAERADLSTVSVVAEDVACKPASLGLVSSGERAVRPTELAGRPAPAPGRAGVPRDSRTPSPAGAPVSRKSSFCSLFKSRETIASPDSPSDALRRKRSLTEGRSRSKSRDRSATPSSVGKIRGSVLSLFKTPRKSCASPSPGSREGSPIIQIQRALSSASQTSAASQRRGEKLKYYEDTRDGIIHIPLRTPPDERSNSDGGHREPESELTSAEVNTYREPPRPASAPHTRGPPDREFTSNPTQKPVYRTVLPDGSIIIPLRSPTEKTSEDRPFGSPAKTTLTSTGSTSAEVESDRHSISGGSGGAKSTDGVLVVECTPETAPSIEPVEATPSVDDVRRKKKERIIFTTHVGSREQVFSTQFSITKTPSVTSEISGSFPSFVDHDESRAATADGARPASGRSSAAEAPLAATPSSPAEGARDSSESEASSEGGGGGEAGGAGGGAGAVAGGSEAERRGLVVQESFEEELPYVPTTLPQERSVALPMVPVRERAGLRLRALQRPRAAPAPRPNHPPLPAPAPAAPPSAPHDRLRIRLPRRTRTSSVAGPPAPPCADRVRTRSIGDECRPKTEWIDFEEVPERRKQPKRIQTLPAGAVGAMGAMGSAEGGAPVLFSYVEPEHCRCECHARNSVSAECPAEGKEALLTDQEPEPH